MMEASEHYFWGETSNGEHSKISNCSFGGPFEIPKLDQRVGQMSIPNKCSHRALVSLLVLFKYLLCFNTHKLILLQKIYRYYSTNCISRSASDSLI